MKSGSWKDTFRLSKMIGKSVLILNFVLIGGFLVSASPQTSGGPSEERSLQARGEDKIKECERKRGYPTKLFEETTPGLDFPDRYFFQDDEVGKRYSRFNFLTTKITMGGQHTDSTGDRPHMSTNPFAIGQRVKKYWYVLIPGSMLDRWDVKDTEDNNSQFFAVYHGNGNGHLLNKLRAHLLRSLANEMQTESEVCKVDLSVSTGQLTGPQTEKLQSDVEEKVRRIFLQVNQKISNNLNAKDSSRVSAGAVMLTSNSFVVAAAGDVKVFAYDKHYLFHDLTKEANSEQFGVYTAKSGKWEPHVKVYSRDTYLFLMILTKSVADCFTQKSLWQSVVGMTSVSKHDALMEQQIFSGSVQVILEHSASTCPTKGTTPIDFTVALIGLTRDYKRVH